MIFGLSDRALPAALPYGDAIQSAALAATFPPCWLYAHGWQETIKISGWMETLGKTPADFISGDGGHGIFQLTATVPLDWATPLTNAAHAITDYLTPAISYWNQKYGFVGDPLIRSVAAEYNAGRKNAEAGHAAGDVGLWTSKTAGVSYPDLVLKYYHQLAGGLVPTG